MSGNGDYRSTYKIMWLKEEHSWLYECELLLYTMKIINIRYIYQMWTNLQVLMSTIYNVTASTAACLPVLMAWLAPGSMISRNCGMGFKGGDMQISFLSSKMYVWDYTTLLDATQLWCSWRQRDAWDYKFSTVLFRRLTSLTSWSTNGLWSEKGDWQM